MCHSNDCKEGRLHWMVQMEIGIFLRKGINARVFNLLLSLTKTTIFRKSILIMKKSVSFGSNTVGLRFLGLILTEIK